MSSPHRPRHEDGRGVRDVRGALRSVLGEMRREVGRDRVPGLAAEIAFFAVLSLFPGLLITAGLLSLVGGLAGAEVAEQTDDRLLAALDAFLTDPASDTVASAEAVFEGRVGGLLTFATLGALVTLSGAWAVIIEALNLAYGVEEVRSWLRRRLLGLGLGLATLVVLVVTLVVVVIGPLLGRGEELADLVGLGGAFAWTWNVLRLPVLFLLVTGWVSVIFHVAPNRRTPWRAAVPGALTTSVLWLVATVGFHAYLRVAGDRNPLLGAFGGGVIVMTWVYLLSIALLLGGELNAVLQDRRGLTGPGESAHD